jgi:hypothetical protein
LPETVLPLVKGSVMNIPFAVLPEMTLRWPATEPPIVLLCAPLSMRMPSPPLAMAAMPAVFVPM